ncbi:MAG: hypothetical protein COB62_06735 [Piscirickettsiaceae bacterium]|nr:MAG: hypothetical protein COB62_06735 [Piscirickettsiaceae bacterium]
MSSLIDFKNVTISMSGKQVLDIDHLSVPAHQCIMLTGRNGSGKTTLFKIISGLLKPATANIEYQGLTLNWKQAKPYIQKDIIYLHQQPYLFDTSVADNIAYGLYRSGISKGEAHKKVMQALQERITLSRMEDYFDEVLVPTEEVLEMRGGQKRKSERKFFPGYVLVRMELNDDTWHLVKDTPRVMGFIGGTVIQPAFCNNINTGKTKSD